MSKQTQLKAAKKRAERTTGSKKKKGAPVNWQRKQNEINNANKRLFGEGGLITDALNKGSAVERALDFAKHNHANFDKDDPNAVLDEKELIQQTRKAVTEVYRLFSYISMGDALNRQGRIEYQVGIDMDDYAKRLVALDKRVQRLTPLQEMDAEEGIFAFELMDTGEEIEKLGTELYAEVTNLEPHGLVLDAYLNQAAHTLISNNTKITDKQVATNQVLEAMAFVHIAKHIEVPNAA